MEYIKGRELIKKVTENGFAETITTEKGSAYDIAFTADECNEYIYSEGQAEFTNSAGYSVTINDDAEYEILDDITFEAKSDQFNIRVTLLEE